MTATLRPPTEPGTAPPAGTTPLARTATPGRPRSRRWLRLVIPFAVVLVVFLGTAVVHALQEPDVTDPAFLNPTSRAGIGADRLAARLGERGVTVDRVTRTSDALVAAYQGDATLFVPAPGLVHRYHLRMLKLLPASTRVVLVQPSLLTLDQGRIPVEGAKTRWATKTVAPGCALPEAAAAGPAGVFHVSYGIVFEETARCYDGALVGTRYAAAEVVLVGASDPFRNDRFAESGNAALATGLLATHKRVIWLDLHRGEPGPGLVDRSPDPGAGAPPSLGTGGSPDPDFPIADRNGPQQGDPQPGGGGGDGPRPAEPPPPPYWKLLPPWAWIGLGLLALAGLGYALSQARRLGPPVSEPLPVAVRAAETVEGRGRLYRRAKARAAALDALRTSAVARLRSALDLAPDAPRATVVAAVAARTGWPPEQVDAILYEARPADDPELVALAAHLDHLLHTSIDVTKGAPR